MIELNEERFLDILAKVIGESEFVQNHPPKLVPEEDRVLEHVLAALNPYRVENGGVLTLKHIHFKERRGNLIVEYNHTGASKFISFVGSHLDVVPANPETWKVNPFKLTREGDQLFGRGTTDCLGHVAMLTDMLCTIGETKPKLTTALTVVFIASEESSSIAEVGVDQLQKYGHLDKIKNGPVFWIDTADVQPCIGTASAIMWSLKATGKLFHSGLPHKGINAIELANSAVAEIQRRFYSDFPPHEDEQRYNFATPSTMKPTQISCAEGGLNQLPPWCEVKGDVRLTPFYSLEECLAKLDGYVADINNNVEALANPQQIGQASKFSIPEDAGVRRGKIEFKLEGEPMRGIACNLNSPGFAALCQATQEVTGQAKPYSICGSLPLVGDLKEAGYDLQLAGYGKTAVYHGDNEYCLLSDMKDGAKILSRVIDLLQ
eukprot:c39004_g1_i1.p1 GENE.c39004_g1_i1~~c39004_g1_i1.p1  ORF type:complete len:433 (+),score=109.42 c39004_g1_i1:75-1373(+)